MGANHVHFSSLTSSSAALLTKKTTYRKASFVYIEAALDMRLVSATQNKHLRCPAVTQWAHLRSCVHTCQYTAPGLRAPRANSIYSEVYSVSCACTLVLTSSRLFRVVTVSWSASLYESNGPSPRVQWLCRATPVDVWHAVLRNTIHRMHDMYSR